MSQVHLAKFALFVVLTVLGCYRSSTANNATTQSTSAATKPVAKEIGLEIKNQHFILQLPPGWTQLPSDDAEQYVFKSAPANSMLTISIMAIGVKKERMREVADKFFQFRLTAEREDKQRSAVIGESWVEPQDSGDVIELAYGGQDIRKRVFRFKGFVTQAKVVSFYLETIGSPDEEAKTTFQQAFEGFKFYVP